MDNYIKNIEIENFKSIKKAKLECEKINLFIGEPNVGKSNVLEAISILGLVNIKNNKYFPGIRYNKYSELFFDFNQDNNISIKSNLGVAFFLYNNFYNNNHYEHLQSCDEEILKHFKRPDKYNFTPEFKNYIKKAMEKSGKNMISPFATIINYENSEFPFGIQNEVVRFQNIIRKYDFTSSQVIDYTILPFLEPPFGNNLFKIVHEDQNIKMEISKLFDSYGLEFVLDIKERNFLIQKKENGIVIQYPYNLMADTLQRYIFHYTAIESNIDSVLLFEEPESHSFPPYISKLADKIVNDETNQYFITTHSPYFFNEIIENKYKETAVFYTYFEDYQTKFKKLTQEQLEEIVSCGTDVFYNLNWFDNE